MRLPRSRISTLRTALGALAALLLAAGPPAQACSICGCGDPLLASSDPAAITGGLRLQLDTQYLAMNAGTDGRPGFTDELTQWSYRLNAVYRPVEPLSLSLTVPFEKRTITTVGQGTREGASSLTGLGDVEVGVRYALWTTVNFGARRVQELAVSGGSSFPTGKSDARDPTGAIIDPHGQLGTGGFGPYAGIHYRFEQADWMAFAAVSYRVRTEASYPDGSRYRFGDALLWSVHAQYRPVDRLALDLGLDGRDARADRAVDPGGTVIASVENTGGTVLSVSPAVYGRMTQSLWLFVQAQLPVVQHLLGEQEVKPTFTGGLQLQVF